ncbi:MAG: hypothetical protein ACR2OZ_02990 [Verrucomicrobiales bacterium]
MTQPRLYLLVLSSALALTSNVCAVDQEITSLEKEHFEKRSVIVRPLLAAYAERLKSLQEAFSRRGDHTRALAVANELSRASAPPASIENPSPETITKDSPNPNEVPPASGTVILTRERAELSGGAALNELSGSVLLGKKGAAVQWRLPKFRLGRYRLWLDYTCPPLNGGRYQLVFSGTPPLDFTAAPTGDVPSLQVDLGEHEFLSSPAAIRIEVTELAAKAAVLMHLQSVRVQPVGRAG